MDVVVPFSTDHPKSRLSGPLTSAERSAFARSMLRDVLDAVVAAGGFPRVLATAPIDVDVPLDIDVPVVVDERPLTPAVNDVIADAFDGSTDAGVDAEPTTTSADSDEVAVVMADLALATPSALRRVFDASGDLVMVPGRGGGTNALVVRHPAFRVDFHGSSYLDHLEIAADVGASVREIDSHRLSTDLDEAGDLAELLIHGDGAASDWLSDAGFTLDVSDGRVGVVRE